MLKNVAVKKPANKPKAAHSDGQRESKEETRRRNEQNILAAAEVVFAEQSYGGASISMIAQRAGMPKSNVIYYFGTKERLYNAVLSNICLLWLEAGDEINLQNDPTSALTSYIHHKMDLARERPHGSKVWANEIIRGAPIIGDFLATTVRDWLAKRASVLDGWMDQGLLRRTDANSVFYMIWASTQHYADFTTQLELLNDREALSDAQWDIAKETVTSMVLTGLGARTE